jgi:hypothetical protein
MAIVPKAEPTERAGFVRFVFRGDKSGEERFSFAMSAEDSIGFAEEILAAASGADLRALVVGGAALLVTKHAARITSAARALLAALPDPRRVKEFIATRGDDELYDPDFEDEYDALKAALGRESR